jgi:hypothetical protein
MSEVGVVGKSRKNTGQGYQFRGLDDVVAAVQPVLAANGVLVVPRVIEREREEFKTAKGGAMFSVRLLVEHSFFAPDGSSVICTTLGEAMDSGDKASNKAMSAALKYALTETLMIPTYEAERDIEDSSPEVAPRQQQRRDDHDLPVDGRPGPGWSDGPGPDANAGQSPRGQATREGGRVSHGAAKAGETRAPQATAKPMGNAEVCVLIDAAKDRVEAWELIKKHCPAAVADKNHPVRVHAAAAVAKLSEQEKRGAA